MAQWQEVQAAAAYSSLGAAQGTSEQGEDDEDDYSWTNKFNNIPFLAQRFA